MADRRAPRIWVTRPLEDAVDFAEALRARGFDPIIEPLFRVAPQPPPDLIENLETFAPDAVIVTSRNALRVLGSVAHVERLKLIPLFAVGQGTAQVASALGFAKVTTGHGRAEDLAELLARDPARHKRLAFIRGEQVTGDLAGALTAAGHSVLEKTVYAMHSTKAPSAELAAQLLGGEIAAVALLSPNAAAQYCRQMTTKGLGGAARNLVHYCLSTRIADEISQLQPTQTKIASHPNVQQLLELMGGPKPRSVH